MSGPAEGPEDRGVLKSVVTDAALVHQDQRREDVLVKSEGTSGPAASWAPMRDDRELVAPVFTALSPLSTIRTPSGEETTTDSRSSALWAILYKHGTRVSGLSAALSTDAMRGLRYCLTWLHYALAHIEYHMDELQALIGGFRDDDPVLVLAAAQKLAKIRHEITELLRTVIVVASKYTSGALPEYARNIVRQCLLSLPERWRDSSERVTCSASQRADKKLLLVDTERTESPASSKGYQIEEIAARKLLSFASESLETIQKMAQVLTDVLAHAEDWVERFSAVSTRSSLRRRRDEDSPNPEPEHASACSNVKRSRQDTNSARSRTRMGVRDLVHDD